MKEQWKEFRDWYDANSEEFDKPDLPKAICSWPKSSWLKYHTRYCIEKNRFFVYPYESLSTNNNDIGTHVKQADVNIFQSYLQIMPKPEYNLPTYEECVIKYDGFFEPLFLYSCLGVSSDELCVDINNTKDRCLYKHYILSRENLPYKIVKSYALSLKPIEANIILNKEGNGLYLYDTTVSKEKLKPVQNIKYLEYLYGVSLSALLHKCGKKELLKFGVSKIVRKVSTKLLSLI